MVRYGVMFGHRAGSNKGGASIIETTAYLLVANLQRCVSLKSTAFCFYQMTT